DRAGEHQGHALLAEREPVLHEEREVDHRHGGGHAGLAATTAGHGPQLAYPVLGRCAVTGHGPERCQLAVGERPAEGRLEDRQPHAPGGGVAEPGAERAAGGQATVNGGGHSVSPSVSVVSAASAAAHAASSSAITCSSVGVASRARRFRPMRCRVRPRRPTNLPYNSRLTWSP